MTTAASESPPAGRPGWPAGHLIPPAALALVVFLVSLAVRLTDLNLYATTDEGYWMQRSVRFGAALARGDLSSTFRAGHPGVTVMWAGVVGIGPAGLTPFLSERFVRHDMLQRAPTYLEAFTRARQSVAVVPSTLVAVAVLLSWRLFGAGPALAGGALLTFDSYIIGMTRLLHVDALLAPLMLVSVLAGLLFWTRAAPWPYLALSSVCGGLAMLTKAPAGVLVLFFGAVCLAGLVRMPAPGARRAARMLRPLVLWGVGAAGIYVLLFPALWVDPIGRIKTLIAFVAAVGLQPHDGNFFMGRPILDDPGLLYYVVALPLRMSPLVALGLALLPLRGLPHENRPALLWMMAYVVLFAILMTIASKKFDRYMLPVLMALDLLAGIGFWRLAMLMAGWLTRATPGQAAHTASREAAPSWLRRIRLGLAGAGRGSVAALVAGVLAAGQLVLLVTVWPYPIAFYNPLAGGPDHAREVIMVGWGEGLEQAADFLNSLPDAEQLVVVTSYNNVVRPQFNGTTLPIAPYIREAPGLPEPDYVVLYVNAIQRRQTSPEIERARTSGRPVFVAHVNGREYAWVYEMPQTGPRRTVPATINDGPEEEEN